MRHLISYDSPGPREYRSERLRGELADLHAVQHHRWAWTLESGLTSKELSRQLKPFLDDGDCLAVVDVTDRELLVETQPRRP